MAYLLGIDAGTSIVIGGALAMSSTAIVLRQLGDQLELARTHARLALGILLFQDLAFAPLLALATALGRQRRRSARARLAARHRGPRDRRAAGRARARAPAGAAAAARDRPATAAPRLSR